MRKVLNRLQPIKQKIQCEVELKSVHKMALFLKALFVSGIFIAFVLLLGSYWETNDDPSIAWLFALENNSYSPFQWRLLSVIMHFLFVNFPIVNWWTANLFFALWVASFAISYVIFRRYPKMLSDIIVCIVLAAVWIVGGVAINFSRIAAIVSMAGCLLIADSLFPCEEKRRIQYAIGCILLLYGASIRVTSALIALGYLAIIGGTSLLFDGFRFEVRWFRNHAKQIMGLCMAALLFFVAMFADSLLLTPEQKEYLDYNSVRSEIQDYIECYPGFYDAVDSYSNAGINNYITNNMLFNWFSEDTEILSLETLEAVAELKTDTGSLVPLETIADSCTEILQVSVILLILLSLLQKKNIIKFIFPIGLARAYSVYLSYAGRLPARVFEPIILLMMVSGVFLASDNKRVSWGEMNEASEHISNKLKVNFLRSAVLVLLSCSGLVCTFLTVKDYASDAQSGEKCWSSNSYMQEFRMNTLDYIENDDDHIYIYDQPLNPYSLSNAYTMWESRELGYCDNLFLLGGWDARHPDNVERLENSGITNPVKAVFENPRVRSVYSPRLMEYLKTNYDYRMTATELMYVGGTLLVQYCAPIDDAVISSGTDTVRIKEVRQCSGEYAHAWYFEARIKPSGDEDRDFYVNVTLDQTRYTYRLRYEDGTLSGYFYHIGDNFNIKEVDVRIFELTNTGYVDYIIR